jgi:hypothetical protein
MPSVEDLQSQGRINHDAFSRELTPDDMMQKADVYRQVNEQVYLAGNTEGNPKLFFDQTTISEGMLLLKILHSFYLQRFSIDVSTRYKVARLLPTNGPCIFAQHFGSV